VVTTTTHKTLRGPRGAIIMCNEELASLIDKAVFPGLQGGPHNHITAGMAVAFKEAMSDEFKEYVAQVVKNSQELCNSLKSMGYDIISGGTDNHMFLVNIMSSSGIGGEEASSILEKVNITVNKNAIPYDNRKPWDPSGIRIGTPAVTTRGMKEKDMTKIAVFIDTAIKNRDNEEVLKSLKLDVQDFASKFPIPGI